MKAGRWNMRWRWLMAVGCLAAILGLILKQPWGLVNALSQGGVSPDVVRPTSVAVNGSLFAVYPFGAVKKLSVWNKPGWTLNGNKPIEVCWERLDDSTQAMRDEVRDAVAKTWAHYGMVSFTGWGACATGARGIRIGVSTSASGTVGLGQELDGVPNGMQLQMDFSEWEYCANQNAFCVRATAVHEFGHALAFAHEQNRDDAPDWCKARHSGDLPDFKVTDYDPQSIMNYCNKAWNNAGLLSDKDMDSVTRIYGARA